jgi:hypothetical protein
MTNLKKKGNEPWMSERIKRGSTLEKVLTVVEKILRISKQEKKQIAWDVRVQWEKSDKECRADEKGLKNAAKWQG